MRTVTFEQKLEESKKILNRLLDPDITLEESLELYENGIKEIKSAQRMIEEAKVKIELIKDKN
ncbi:Exodeoxyribonuclease VII small subunit [hydrothermal vent metagenome]|uniref:Exodeoxyribonuclease VII small subunit n=1 Tax=hydrothermal vent metagenome TaxID=652676 RepID=A0A1W1BJK8_9ZZZZ